MSELQISLAAARINAQLTQDDVAKQLGVGKQTIVNWEKGKTLPKIDKAKEMCKLYKIHYDNILWSENQI